MLFKPSARKQNETGFTGVIEIIVIIFVILILCVAYKIIQHVDIKTDQYGYKDTYDCRAFHNYVAGNFSLPSDLKLKERSYGACGNYFTLPTGGTDQNIELGYQSNKKFSDVISLKSYLTGWVEKHGGGNDNSSTLNSLSPYFYYPKLTVNVTFLAYKPATIEVNISSTADYKSYPKTSKPSSPQIILSNSQRIKNAPFDLYVPTVNSSLQPIPPQANLIKIGASYMRFNYLANGIDLSYSSPQVASNQCSTIYSSNSVNNCVLWAVTPKAHNIYIKQCTTCISHPDTLGADIAYITIGNSLVELSRDNNEQLTKSAVISIVDSLQKIN